MTSQPPAAYLNDTLIGYGHLSRIAEYVDLRNWSNNRVDQVVTSVRVAGEICIPPELIQSATATLAAHTSHALYRFSGQILDDRNNLFRSMVNILAHVRSFEFSLSERRVSGKIEIELPVSLTNLSYRGGGQDVKICKNCCYFLQGNPSICNAFHPAVGVSECVDFQSR